MQTGSSPKWGCRNRLASPLYGMETRGQRPKHTRDLGGPSMVVHHRIAIGIALACLPMSVAANATVQGEPVVVHLSLENAIALAQSKSTSIDRAARMAEIAKLQTKSARSAYLPSLGVNVQASQSASGSTFQANGAGYSSGFVGNFISGVSVNASLPVDISGTIKRSVEQARLSQTISELTLEDTQRDAWTNVQIAYLTALRAQKVVETDERILGSIVNLRDNAEKQLPSITPFLDVELATARQTMSLSRSSAEQAQDGLKLALQLPFDILLDLTSQIPDPPKYGAGSFNIDQRVDLQSATVRVKQADLSARQARDYQKPSLTLGAYATQTFGGRFISNTGQTSTRNYGLTIGLNLPLLNFDAGRSGNSRKTSELLAEQARRDLEAQKRNAELEVRQAEATYSRAIKRLSDLPDARAAETAAESVSKVILSLPAATAQTLLAQVSNARAQWRAAEVAVVDASVEATIAWLRLQQARGADFALN